MTAMMLIGAVAPDVITGDAPPHLRVSGAPWDGLALPVTEPPEAVELVQAQHHILCSYAHLTQALPIALGAAFSSRAALAAHLHHEAPRLDALTQRLAGRREYAVRIMDAAARPPVQTGPATAGPATTGRAHLRRRRDARQAREQRTTGRQRFVQDTLAALQTLTDSLVARPGQVPGRLAAFHLLLAQDRVALCQDLLGQRQARAQALGLQIALVGPHAAFSFLEEAADA